MPPQKKSQRGKSLDEATEFILSRHLWAWILAGMVLGVLVGLGLSPEGAAIIGKETAYTLGEWIALPGTIFLSLIQMVVIPLVICSIILGVTDSGSLGFLGRMGARLVPYFIFTTMISITIGIVLVQLIRPGDFIDQSLAQTALASGAASGNTPQKTFNDLTIPQRIANLIPTNLARAELDKNMLQIVIASILVGIAMLSIPASTGKPLKDLCVAGQVVSMKIISWAMAIAPLAVFGLLCNITIRIGFDAVVSVGVYAMTVITGLFCMVIVYKLIVKILAGRSIFDFFAGIREAQLIAFSTSSSAATMPVSIKAAEEKLKIRPEIARVVIPLGATINMDGTALYQAVAALFLCQVFGIDLTFPEMVLLLLTTTGASIGTPATPGVGIVVLATILIGIGVPPEGIALIVGVDRILDMCRTTVNVTGDLTATTVMEKWMPAK